MNKALLFLFSLYVFGEAHSALIDQLRPVGVKNQQQQVRNVDFIYLINLDRRPARWENVQKQFKEYKIYPHRFSAIDGWFLSPQVLNDIGVLFTETMKQCPSPDCYGAYYADDGSRIEINLDEHFYGKRAFSHFTTLGAIGASLSHLSILEDAYNSEYETIWVMEDDVIVKDNPHKISEVIDQLDQLVGCEEWDILYTDEKHWTGHHDYRDENLLLHNPWLWRPDMVTENISYMALHKDMGDFIKMVGKVGTHSMIIRRSGIKKILDYEKTQGIFLPIDVDRNFIVDLNTYVVKKDIVVAGNFPSDTTHFVD